MPKAMSNGWPLFSICQMGFPHADTCRRLFERIDPKALERCFFGWIGQIVEATGAQVIPIHACPKPSKGLMTAIKGNRRCRNVSAWASENRLLLGQVKVESKTNEIKAIPALLELLDISGCIITTDAMGTQHKIAGQILAKGADYVLCLKANHPTLWAQVKAWYELALANEFEGIDYSYSRRVEAGHHRREDRQVWAVPVSCMRPLHASKSVLF